LDRIGVVYGRYHPQTHEFRRFGISIPRSNSAPLSFGTRSATLLRAPMLKHISETAGSKRYQFSPFYVAIDCTLY
jgi:hypothetical protein